MCLSRDPNVTSARDVADFTLFFVHKHEEGNTTLYSNKIENASEVVAREIARRLKVDLMKPGVLLNLWAKRLGEELGFEVDLGKGLEYFFEDVAKNCSSELLNLYLTEVEYEPYRIAVENELKTRGET